MKRVLLLAFLSFSQLRPALAGQLTLAGAEDHDKGHQVLAFLPNELWIHQGDSVTWSFPTARATHGELPDAGAGAAEIPGRLSWLCAERPTYDGTACVNSDVLMNGQTYTVTFPQRGNFKLACLVHLYMTGVVHVLDGSAALPHDQAAPTIAKPSANDVSCCRTPKASRVERS